MQNQLQRIINLAKKTGDRVIAFDSLRPEDAYVLMSMDDYEKISDTRAEVRNLTETGLVDKINRDIAIWKSENETSGGDFDFSEEIEEFSKPENNEKMISIKEVIRESRKKNSWSIPKERKAAAAEDAGQIMEEDRQYLEDIPGELPY